MTVLIYNTPCVFLNYVWFAFCNMDTKKHGIHIKNMLFFIVHVCASGFKRTSNVLYISIWQFLLIVTATSWNTRFSFAAPLPKILAQPLPEPLTQPMPGPFAETSCRALGC